MINPKENNDPRETIQPRKKHRKTRSDKGEVRATPRDITCITWIAHQYAARGDQIQRLLTRYPDPDRPFKGELASPSTTREQISRWVRAGWIVYKRVLAAGPGWAYVTKAGLRVADLEDVYTARPPSEKRLTHIYGINQLRLWMDAKEGYNWLSERFFIASLTLKRGESSGPIPDALIFPNGVRTALEVQLSSLKPAEWVRKLRGLINQWRENEIGGYERSFPRIWVYVPDEKMKEAFEAACLKLAKEDQERVSCAVQDYILMKNAWL